MGGAAENAGGAQGGQGGVSFVNKLGTDPSTGSGQVRGGGAHCLTRAGGTAEVEAAFPRSGRIGVRRAQA